MLPLILSLSGLKITNEEKAFFLKNEPLGFILFRRNIENFNQVTDLISDLKALYPNRFVPIFTDQEGGRVQRVIPPLAKEKYPSAETFDKLYQIDDEQAKIAAYENSKNIMAELKNLGIDSPCAPVADICFEGAHDIIGDRSFGKNVTQVVELCTQVIEGILAKKGIPIIKHFPGHGRAISDSHYDLPIVEASLEELEHQDFAVFKQLADKFGNQILVMSAHIIYTAFDSEKPFTLSQKAINYVRQQGITNILISDSGEMAALHPQDNLGKKYSYLEAAMRHLKLDKLENKLALVENLIKVGVIQEDFLQQSFDKQKQTIDDLFNQYNPIFAQSLANVAKESIDAGCDFFLYCNGDLTHMEAICSTIEPIVDLSRLDILTNPEYYT